MTDNEIIKALGCLIHDNCEDCQYYPDDCTERIKDPRELSDYALGLIIRQRAELERLQKKVDELSEVLSDSIRIRYKEAKSEAVKEFVDRLKEVSSKFIMCDNGTQIIQYHQISTRKLDSILKEMVGEEE